MRPAALLCTAFLWVPCFTRASHAQRDPDVTAINHVIDQYGQTEDAGDMMAQSRLMTADRIWVAQAGRRTDQEMNMRLQQAQIDEGKKFAPGTKWFTESRDRLIKVYGNGSVAVASFYWHRTRAVPGDLPVERARLLGDQPPPAAITHVLVKQSGEWKIAHTHVTTMIPDGFVPAGQD